MNVKPDGGSFQEKNAPRYVVSIGSYVNEGAALTRRDQVSKAGYRAEVIDLNDDNTTTTVTALLLIAERVNALSEKLDELTQAVKTMQSPKTETKTEPKTEPKTVGEIINGYRVKKGLSLRDLSAASGIPRGTLSNYCAGAIKQIPAKAILVLQGVLNIPNDEIIKYL